MKKLILIIFAYSLSAQNFLTPEQMGYPGYGYAQSYIQAALDSTGACELMCKTYPISSTVYLSDKDIIRGCFNNSRVQSLQDIRLFEIQGNNITLKDFAIGGYGGATEQYGIYCGGTSTSNMTDYYGISILNVYFDQPKTAGLFVRYNVPANFRVGITAINCRTLGCDWGYVTEERGEYNLFMSCHAYENTLGGWLNRGGNNSWSGGSLTYNPIGIKLSGGVNDGHNHMQGATINHNTISVLSDGLGNGYEFNGCDIHTGDIKILNSEKIRFIGGAINFDTDSLIISGSSVSFLGVDMLNTTKFSVTDSEIKCNLNIFTTVPNWCE